MTKNEIANGLINDELGSALLKVYSIVTNSNDINKDALSQVETTWTANSFTESEIDNGYASVFETCKADLIQSVKNIL